MGNRLGTRVICWAVVMTENETGIGRHSHCVLLQVVAFDNMPKAIERVRETAERMGISLDAVVLDVKDVCRLGCLLARGIVLF
jgi:hypothetical protein